MGVLDRRRFGLFDIVTRGARRQGLGAAHAAIADGQECAATCSQVVATARSLYARLGFTDAYGYWYRIAAPK